MNLCIMREVFAKMKPKVLKDHSKYKYANPARYLNIYAELFAQLSISAMSLL